jgi:hypothetical protein
MTIHRFAAQANARLLQVLADLVKAFIDTESEIQSSLAKLGFPNNIRSSSGDDFNNNDNQEHDSLSREEILSSLEQSLEDALVNDRSQSHQLSPTSNHQSKNMLSNPTVNQINSTSSPTHSPQQQSSPSNVADGFQEDGDELITNQGDASLFHSIVGEQVPDLSNLNISDDVVLGASRRLRSAVSRILALLRNVAELQYGPSRSGCNSAASSVDLPSNGRHCTECDKLRRHVSKMEHELEDIQLDNRLLKEKVNEQHCQLSKMKVAIDNTNVLEAQSLKAKNDELKCELMQAKMMLEHIKESQESHVSKGREFSSRLEESYSLDCPDTETARRAPVGSPMESFRENNFYKSEDLLNLDELDSMSLKDGEEGREVARRPMDDDTVYPGFKEGDVANAALEGEVTSPLKKALDAKDAEIKLLRSQMKLAQDMLASAFPNLVQPSEDSQVVLDVDLLENLVESHLNRVVKSSAVAGELSIIQGDVDDEALASPSGSSTRGQVDNASVVSSYDGLDNTSFMEVQKMDEKMNKLYSMVETLLSSNKQLQKQIDTYHSSKMSLEKLRKDAVKEADNLKAKVKELETENFSIKMDLQKSRSDLQQMKKEVDDKEQEIHVHQSTVRIKDEEIDSMQIRIDTLLQRIDTLMDDKERRKMMERKEETEWTAQINQLKNNNNQQHQEIQNYQAKVAFLLSKIEQLEMEVENVGYKDQRIKELELKVKTSEQVIVSKKEKIKQLFDSLTKMSTQAPLFQPKCHSSPLYTKDDVANLNFQIRKLQHDKRCLVFQKNYLVNVLCGFQLTEKATFSILNSLNYPVKRDSCVVVSPLKKFRTVVFAVIAIRRMKLLVERWSFKRKYSVEKGGTSALTPPKCSSGSKTSSEKKRLLSQSSVPTGSSTTSSSSSLSNIAAGKAIVKSKVTDREVEVLRSQFNTVQQWCESSFPSHR